VANFHRDNSRGREISIDEMLMPPPQLKTDHPESSALKQESINYLMNLINDLHADKRELIMLKFVHKLSNEEIARALGRTEGAIKSLYHRTLLELRDHMDRLEGTSQRNRDKSVDGVNTELEGENG